MSLLVLGAGLALAGPAAAADQPIAFGDYAYSPTTTDDQDRRHGDLQRQLLEPPARVGRRQPRDHQHRHVEGVQLLAARDLPLPLPDPRRDADGMAGSAHRRRRPAPGHRLLQRQPVADGRPAGHLHLHRLRRPRRHADQLEVGPRRRRPFETTTPTGVATTTYATARTVTVRMVAVDDSGEGSATAEQAVTIAAAGSGVRRLGQRPRAAGTPPPRGRRSSSSAG